MHRKKTARVRRAKRSRRAFIENGKIRLSVTRTPKHIYAQVLSADGGTVIASASTLQKSLGVSKTGNVDAAAAVGKAVARMAIECGVNEVSFDRSGYKYHGRVKALADAARQSGLKF